MSVNRIGGWVGTETTSIGAGNATTCLVAFMPCPCPVLNALSQTQQLQLQQIYRIAREEAEQNLAPSQFLRMIQFSAN